jgi:protocatechuate 3,4-dioxygenase, alpha subunit
MEKLQQTPSQTIGPFFAYSLTAEQYGYDFNSIINGSLVGGDTEGERIFITGSIYDGNGNTIPDAMIEILQADSGGNYVTRYPDVSTNEIPFKGLGRLGTGTDTQHRFTFKTIKPGTSNDAVGCINVMLFMRGSLRGCYTRMYFSDELNDKDPLLNSIDPARRHTLMAQRKDIDGGVVYHFDIHMQGENETVFFDI